MISIFYGEDRIKANKIINERLGKDYEVVDGQELQISDLPSVFYGNSLFVDKRFILIRDLSENRGVFEKLPDFLDSPHEIIIFETKLDKRSTIYKKIKDQIEIKEFKTQLKIDTNVVFDIFRIAKRDGGRAVQMLENIREEQDPYMFFGLLVSQAMKDFSLKQGVKEKRVLEELSKLDIQMKTVSIQPWLLIESFLLQVSLL